MENENGHIGLLELQQTVKEVLEDGLEPSYWVKAEISEIKQNPTGHCYMTLVEKDPRSNSLLAKAQAIVWASAWRVIRPFFEQQTGSRLAAGMQILVRAQVNYSVLYGLSLVVFDIDPAFSVGELELQRRRTIERLEKEGMMGLNAEKELPLLPRRLAVVSSATAAGFRDFERHLHENEYGFRFSTTLFPALMQGAEAPASIIAALDEVSAAKDSFDAVLILRGGGGAMDLVCFDDEELALNVAQFPLPVLTAIGHDHDYHVIDMVAHTYVKTPTALADWILDRFSGELWQLDSLLQRLHLAVGAKAMAQVSVLERMKNRIAQAVVRRYSDLSVSLDRLEMRVDAVNPQKALERGFLIALRDGRRTAEASSFTPGDRLTILFRDGNVEARVTQVNENKD